ncbi:kinase-like protein [Pluteus cervinus]|uniref:Kinase-like protein n=1 Tax=Pluteus cervinus TaxID=181527 RepID=A0ACD3B8C1_9AGAR|nr:kinase-like protein [Pluteus cervinus]
MFLRVKARTRVLPGHRPISRLPPFLNTKCRVYSSKQSSNVEPNRQEHQEDEPRFKYPEETLGIPAEYGFGYYQGGPGRRLGLKGRYEIRQKLGHGSTSSVWLAKDRSKNTFHALKILSGFATELNVEHKLQELDVHQRLGKAEKDRRCVTSTDHFFEAGIDEDDGPHLCLVQNPTRCDLYEVIKTLPKGTTFPLPIIKRITKDVLSALALLHERGIAHTDLKQNNIMVALEPQFDIAQWLAENPPKAYDPVPSFKGPVVSYKSHQFPPPPFEELSNARFIVSDFRSAQILAHKSTDHITPLGLRSPEIVLGGPWDQSVDIWTLGNLVFFFLTLQDFIVKRPSPCQLGFFWPQDLRPAEIQEALEANKPIPESIDFLLYQMAAFCENPFPAELLQVCPKTAEYFDLESGRLKRFRNQFRKCG